MSGKKNPAALIAGIAAAVIGVSIIAVAVLAVAGIITLDKPVGSADADKAEGEEPPRQKTRTLNGRQQSFLRRT